MTDVAFSESEERQTLRREVARLAKGYGREYFTTQARTGGKTTELWLEIAKNGYLGINIPEEYGGGGGGIGDIAAVCEELAAQGCPLLMMVVSPAICGTVITRYGTEEQKRRWLPGIADGTRTMAFAITEPDAGTNSHNITTTARRDGDGWVLNGRKIYISGVDEAANVLVVARAEDARTGKLKPCLFVVPTNAEGFEAKAIPMEIVSPELQFQVFIDDVRLPDDALVGDPKMSQMPGFSNSSRGSTRSGSWRRRSPPAWPGTRSRRPRRTPGSARSSRARSARTRRSRTRWRSPGSRSSSPG